MGKENFKNKDRYSKIVFLSLIILLTIITFSNSLFNELITYDDPGYIIKNELIRGLSYQNIRLIFYSFVMGNYHPLVVLSDAIVFHFFNLNPIAYHSFSLFLHLINVVLVFNLVLQLDTRHKTQVSRQQTADTNIKGAALVSCLFAIHPMHCETICWVSDQKDLLFTLFYLASLIYYVKYKTEDTSIKTQENKNSKVKSQTLKINSADSSQLSAEQSKKLKVKSKKIKFYLISLLLFVCSCLSKSAAVTFPLIMIATDYLLRRKLNLRTVIEKIPFFILSIFFGIVNIYSQASVKAYFDNLSYNISDRIFIPIYNLVYYLIFSIIPYKLSVIHPYPEKSNSLLPLEYYIFPLIVLILIVLIVILRRKRKTTVNSSQSTRNLIFGLLFFIINVALVLQIIPIGNSVVSERYSYLSYFGLFFIIGQLYVLHEFNRITRRNLNIIVVFILLLFSFISHERNKVWANSLGLYSDVIEKFPRSCMAYGNRGNVKYRLGDLEGAIDDYNKAIDINSKYEDAIYNRGNARFKFGDKQGALKDYNMATELNPEDADAFNNRGYVKYNLGDKLGAIKDYNKAIELNPHDADAFNNRGFAKYNEGNIQGALEDYNMAIEQNPEYAEALNNRGSAKGQLKDYRGAIQDFNRAIEINPQNALAFYNRGNANNFLGDKERACSDWKRASEFGLMEANELIKNNCK